MNIEAILEQNSFTQQDIAALISVTDPRLCEKIRARAESILLERCGDIVWRRGLIEFSNVCARNCYYCGIRRAHKTVRRYTMTCEEIVEQATWCASQGYGSLVLQSGERQDSSFIDLVERCVRTIKERTRSALLPRGLGITLCIGEQSRQTYQRLFDAGAHRYLLRIESSSPHLFAAWHPSEQKLESRIACLKTLKAIGYQVGTGVMIGVPGQTVADLAADILFFRDMDIDMIGMGPYIVHPRTPFAHHAGQMAQNRQAVFERSLTMIAVTRIVLRDVNIAATTALQTMDPTGREQGLRHGANVVMPQLTPADHRADYLLYEGKPCLDETAQQCKGCLEARIAAAGRRTGCDDWGDANHFFARQSLKQ